MKLLAKKQPERPVRQRQTGAQRAPSSYSYLAQRAERPEAAGRQKSSMAVKRSKLLSVRFWAKRSGAIIAVVIFVVCIISLLSVSTKPRVVLLDEGNTYSFRDATVYEAAAAKQLKSSIWNRNKITVNTGAAASAITKQFPEISAVNITLPLVGQRPIIYLQANAPAFAFRTTSGSYVLDANGKAILAQDSAPESVVNSLPVITDQSRTPVQPGKQIISRSSIQFIQTVVKTLESKDLKAESIILPAENVQQLHVKVSGQPYVIKFDMQNSGGARQQVGTYLATANDLKNKNITPGQYIDVRVLGRSYYL